MSIVNYAPSSPYYNTPQSSYYTGFWNPPAVYWTDTDQFVTVAKKYTNRPDLLSYDLYGTSRLWWIFAMMNPNVIRDPIYDLQAGIELRIPSRTSVQVYL